MRQQVAAVWLYLEVRSFYYIKIIKINMKGWVLPKGTVEEGEEYKETAIREVKEETGAKAAIIKYVEKVNILLTRPTI